MCVFAALFSLKNTTIWRESIAFFVLLVRFHLRSLCLSASDRFFFLVSNLYVSLFCSRISYCFQSFRLVLCMIGVVITQKLIWFGYLFVLLMKFCLNVLDWIISDVSMLSLVKLILMKRTIHKIYVINWIDSLLFGLYY